MSAELRPCPFCGGEDIWYEFGYDDGSANCRGCGAVMPIANRDHIDGGVILEAWNRRPVEDELLAALKELAEDLENELASRYAGTENYPNEMRRRDRDMASIAKARAAIAKAEGRG